MNSTTEIERATRRDDDAPRFTLVHSDGHLHLTAQGNWTLNTIINVDQRLKHELENFNQAQVSYDFDGISVLDTAGAYVLSRAIKCESGKCYDWDIKSEDKGHEMLMQSAANARMGQLPAAGRMWYDVLVRMGKATHRFWDELYDTLAFLGHFFIVLLKLIVRPKKIRWKSVTAMVEQVGIDAAPIIMVLSFFIGAVIAYMGANLLASFGAQIFMVELVGFSVLREFGVLITAIMLAGRSDSAFTAQIGAMRMRQEIDAMTVIGMETYETLVVPRALACLISAPILTFLAMLSGLFGGMLVAWLGPTDVSPILFLARLKDSVPIQHFWVGMIKAPFFALIIAVVGCRQGLAVTGSVESLGSRTTASVVQAIFAVITIDAMFAMLFLQLDI